jgi:hypothetical protein
MHQSVIVFPFAAEASKKIGLLNYLENRFLKRGRGRTGSEVKGTCLKKLEIFSSDKQENKP